MNSPLKEIDGYFTYIQRFGQGSYGEVFKAEHKKTGRVVAIKKVFKGAQNLAKHMPEIRAMKSCDSPFIVGYYGCEWLREDLLIAMELCEFGSLSDVMKIRQRAFTEDQVAYIMRRTLSALDYLASNRKVHRDIKPANIMLTAQGKIKLGDLGITKELRPDGTLRDRIGSVLYLAPEIARDTPYDSKVDIWSLGITAVELLLGRAPRSSERTKEILRLLVTDPKGPSIQLPHASPELLSFLHRLLKVDPLERPTASELLKDPFIVRASSSSMVPIIMEMERWVEYYGGFQNALLQAANARIEVADPSTDLSLMDTDCETEDEIDIADLNAKLDAIVEPRSVVDARVAREVTDSPVWNHHPGCLQDTFSLGQHRPHFVSPSVNQA